MALLLEVFSEDLLLQTQLNVVSLALVYLAESLDADWNISWIQSIKAKALTYDINCLISTELLSVFCFFFFILKSERLPLF